MSTGGRQSIALQADVWSVESCISAVKEAAVEYAAAVIRIEISK